MTITLATPYASLGDIPVGTWERVLAPLSGPMLLSLEAIVKAAAPHGALCLVQAIKESTAGRDDTAKQALNAWGLMVRPGSSAPFVRTKYGYRLQVFPTWAAGAREFSARLDAPPYTQVTTLGEYIDLYFLGWLPGSPHTYPPGNTPADRDLYRSQTVERLNSYGAGGETPVPTRTKPTVYDIRVPAHAARFNLDAGEVQALLASCIANRDGLKPKAIVWHIQDGITTGSLDWWVHGPGVQASASAMANKDGSILRVIPDNHGPWTNGDVSAPNAWGQKVAALGNGDPNAVTLTIEAEGKPNVPLTAAQDNAILWQTEEWMRLYGIPATMVGPHSAINSVSRSQCGLYAPRLKPLLNAGPPSKPEPLVDPDFPWLTHTRLGEFWGTRTDAEYAATGVLSTAWRERGLTTGQFPELTWYGPLEDGKLFRFLDGWTVYADAKGIHEVKE